MALRGLMLGLLMLWQGWAMAVPQINWSDMLERLQGKETRESLEIDLRQRWESIVVGSVEPDVEKPLDPDQIWRWPAERFSSMPNLKPVSLSTGERKIARLSLLTQPTDNDLSVTVMMPRLDAAHLSYRYDNGPWITLSAGDRLAMNRWPLADRQPTFHINPLSGRLDVVMQFAHRGILDAPVLLQNNRSFLESRTSSIWSAGAFSGIHAVMALMGVLLAINFQKIGFLSIAVMSLMMSLVLMFGSGLGGMVVNTGSENFNDQIKFIINTTWGMLLPWVAALALSMQVHSRRWWWSSVALAALGGVMALAWANYRWRDTAPIVVSSMLIFVLFYVLCMMAWSWYKNFSRHTGIAVGLLLYTSSMFILFAAYLGALDTDASGILAALVCLLASLSLIRGLFLQHRMGRQLLARANISPLRDVLTGLLNREGLQVHLYKVRERLQQQQNCAVFIYISVLDTEAAMDEHGEQGVEMGMVQMAASLSTSMTAVDGLGRISGQAFGISVLMPPDPTLAIRTAQKILTHLMVLASHGVPMASTVRMALAWMPLHGFRLDTLERQCQEALDMLEPNKRIGWVGGVDSYKDASQLLRNASPAYPSKRDLALFPVNESAGYDATSANLYERIHRIEREMLHGMDTRFLVEEAERMSKVLNDAHAQQSRQPDEHQGVSQPIEELSPETQPMAAPQR
jgi:GGDEF domain-containing protein